MSRERAQTGPADDLAFSGARFAGGHLAGVLGDTQHVLDARGRDVASDRYKRVAFPETAGAVAELARYHFTGLPGEDEYRVRLVLQPSIEAPADSYPTVMVYWRVRTQTSGGLNVSTDTVYNVQTISTQDRGAMAVSGLEPLAWPVGGLVPLTGSVPEVETPVAAHRIDTALPRSGRLLSIYGYTVGCADGLIPAVYLRAVFATGHRRNV